MKNELIKIKKEMLEQIEKAQDTVELEDIKNAFFARKGKFTELIKGVKELGREEKPVIGKMINDIKNEIDSFVERRMTDLGALVDGVKDDNFFDPTLPSRGKKTGTLHPLTQLRAEIEDVFQSMGFRVIDGPELESEWYNFEAMNIEATHPARDMQDTFYIENKNGDDLVMRTHTSNLQVRALEKYGAPLRCIAPGRVYRNEATDARHEHTFHQVEGLVVGEDISIASLKATIDIIIKSILGENYKTRLRPGYFPFVEPGIEVDLSCQICKGVGCKVCKGTGWVEFMGAGMVHPKVIEAGGVDSEKYSGFAFGFGLERLAMMCWGIDDIRLFHSGDLRFIEQF